MEQLSLFDLNDLEELPCKQEQVDVEEFNHDQEATRTIQQIVAT